MCFEQALLLDKLFRLFFTIVVLFYTRKVDEASVYFEPFEHLIQKPLKVVLMPHRSTLAGAQKDALYLALEVLSVDEKNSPHRGYSSLFSNSKPQRALRLAGACISILYSDTMRCQ